MAVAALLTGCDLDPGSSSQPSAASTPDPDQRIVADARAVLTALLIRLPAHGATESLVAAHRAQLVALDGTAPARTHHPFSRSQVVAHERRAADRFERWAVACANGDLARLLASIAAGIRMQPVLRGTS